MSSAPRYYTNGRVARSAAEEARHQGETPRGSRHPRKPQGSRAESGSRWVVEVVEVEVVEVLFRSTAAPYTVLLCVPKGSATGLPNDVPRDTSFDSYPSGASCDLLHSIPHGG